MSPRSSGRPAEPRGTVVVVPTSTGGPPGAPGRVTSGRGGSIVERGVGDPVEGDVVDRDGGDVVDRDGGDVVDRDGGDVIGSLVGGSDGEPAGSGRVLVVVGVLSCCSRSCSSTSPGVIGAGRATLTSRATRSTAALTPSTIRTVVTTQVTEIRSAGPMMQVCDRLLPRG